MTQDEIYMDIQTGHKQRELDRVARIQPFLNSISYEKVIQAICIMSSPHSQVISIPRLIEYWYNDPHYNTTSVIDLANHLSNMGFRIFKQGDMFFIDLTPEPVGWWAKLKYAWKGPF